MRMIPIHQLALGLYWLSQKSPTKGVQHHAILDVGNRLGHHDIDPRYPIIVHQTPPSITRERFAGTGDWELVLKIADEPSARQRLIAACANPIYNAAGNNCEHFARYIATGKRESHQVRAVGFVGVLIGLAWAAAT